MVNIKDLPPGSIVAYTGGLDGYVHVGNYTYRVFENYGICVTVGVCYSNIVPGQDTYKCYLDNCRGFLNQSMLNHYIKLL